MKNPIFAPSYIAGKARFRSAFKHSPSLVPQLVVDGTAKGVQLSGYEMEDATDYELRWRRAGPDTRPPIQERTTDLQWTHRRICQRESWNSTTGTYQFRYTGAGVRVYVFDTGVRYTHQEFGGRTLPGYSAMPGYSYDDDTCPVSHGTLCASLVAGAKFGLAPGAHIVSLKGLMADGPRFEEGPFFECMNWILNDHLNNNPTGLSVLNHSVLNTLTTATWANAALAKWHEFMDAGIVCALSGGNNNNLPTGIPRGVTNRPLIVGGSRPTDAKASNSAYGGNLSIFAPQTDVTGASAASDTATRFFSGAGTSTAAPRIAGIAAMLLEENPSLGHDGVWAVIRGQATRNLITAVPSGHTDFCYSLSSTWDWTRVVNRTGLQHELPFLEVGHSYEAQARALVDGIWTEWSDPVVGVAGFSGVTNGLRAWDNAEWKSGSLKRWNNTDWDARPLRVFNGTDFV